MKDMSIVIAYQKCLDANGEGCEKWESEINRCVAKLYGLTASEIAIVEGK